MSLLGATDTGVRARGGRRLIVLRRWAFVAAMGLGVDPAMAEEPAAQVREERRIVLARTPAGHPATIYGAAGKQLLLLFDAPLGKGAIRAPGVEIRRQPSNRKALVLIPSRALAPARGPVPLVVPLVSGPVALALALRPEAPDGRVRIFRPLEPARPRLDAPGAPARLVAAATSTSRGHASPPPLIEMVLANPWEATVPDDAMQCRLSFIVRTQDTSSVHAVEIRTTDRTLCEPHFH